MLAGKYRLEALLGSGGMGHVYRAVNELVGRPVAIKLLRAEHAENGVIVERFLREARAANLVRHPNVVDVVDIGTDESGTPFIVQELLQGEDLSQYARRRGGPLGLEEVVDFLCPVIDAVAEAHARGVVHRDLKPENVFLAEVGGRKVPKLLDFGISKVRSSDVRATEAGVMMGTPAYMAPEQVQGARDTDARSDVWALGVMLFELLSGRLPFDWPDAPALFVAIATKDAPRLLDVNPEVGPDASRIVERCLRRLPDDRYPSAAELARDLRHMVEGTELEPTGKRSIPPGLAKLVPDLVIPPPAPTPKEPVAEEAEETERAVSLASEDLLTDISTPPDAAPSQPALPVAPTERPAPPPPEGTGEPPRAPSLVLSAPAAPPARPAAAPAALPGVMLAPGAATAGRRGPPAASPLGELPRASAGPDLSAVASLAVVGLVVIVGLGVLMPLAHRPEGWPVARFFIAASGLTNTAIQLVLGVATFLVGANAARRAFRRWSGDDAGGAPSAVLSALVASAFFFCTVELVSAAW